jgi:hypothetical protein
MAYLQCTIVTGSACVLQVRASGSLTNPTVFSVDGNQGRLLEVTDDLSCSLFSANTIAGLPVIEAFANYCVVMGQYGGHQLQVTCTSIRGGKCTTASGTYSFVGGGSCNCATGAGGGTMSGDCNFNTGACSFIGGGCRNSQSGVYSFIGGGNQNRICSNNGNTISGGAGNLINTGNYNTIGGGISNCVFNSNRATVGGGCANTASGNYSTVAGGAFNTASGYGSAVLGGLSNCASATYSGAFGIGLSANVACTFFTNNQCTCGNINASGNITASNLSSGTHSPITVFTSNVSSNTNYTNIFMRVGSVVTVSGRIDITPSSSGNATVGISLPIASNFTADTDLSGTITSLGQRLGIIIADTTNDVAQIIVFAAGGVPVTYTFVYQYRIL